MTTNGYRALHKPIFTRLRPGERKLILFLGDLAATVIALITALYFWAARDNWLSFNLEFLQTRPPEWFFLLPVGWIILLVELYDTRRSSRRTDTLIGILIAAAISLVIYTLVFFFATPKSLPRFGVAAFILTAFSITLIWRMIYINIFTAPLFLRRVLIVGAGRAGFTLGKVIGEIWPAPFVVVGYVDDDPQKIGQLVGPYPVLSGSDRLLEVIQEHRITDIIFSISGDMRSEMFQALIKAEEEGIEITTMPLVYEELLGRVPIFLLQSDWILRSFLDQAHAPGPLFDAVKRLIDIVGGLVGCLVFLGLFPILALLVLIDDGFPILYNQARVGKNGREYVIYKFRTMRRDAEKDGQARLAVENDERVTRSGRFLRKTHLDELPQFINVLAGDMALVGPRAERPELVCQLQEKVPFYRARLMVRPGLTGWAQINQPYAATLAEMGVKLEYDLYYIKHRNLILDFTILVRTFGMVFGFKGQ